MLPSATPRSRIGAIGSTGGYVGVDRFDLLKGGHFAFMLSSLWASLQVTFVGVPESAPEEDEAEESTAARS